MSDNVASGGSTGSVPASTPTGGPAANSTPSASPATPTQEVSKAPASTDAVHAGESEGSSAPPGDVPNVEPKKYKIRAKGKEFEVTEQEAWQTLAKEMGEDGVLDLVKLRRGAYDVFEESKKVKKQLQDAVATIRDPRKLWQMVDEVYGPDQADKVLEQWYQDRQRLKQMTPEQRRAHEERVQFEHEKQQVLAERRRQEAAARQQQTNAAAKQVRERFTAVLSEVGLEANDALVGRMALKAKQRISKGIPAVYSDMAREVRDEIRAELGTVVQKLTPDQLREFLGDERVQAIRLMEAERLKTGGPVIQQPRGQDGKFVPVKGKSTPDDRPRKRPMSEVFAERRANRAKGG